MRVNYPEAGNGVKVRIDLSGAVTALNYPQPPYVPTSPFGGCSEREVSYDGYSCGAVGARVIECIATYLPAQESIIPLCLGAVSPGSYSITATAEPYWTVGPSATTTLTGNTVAAAVADVRIMKVQLSYSTGAYVGLQSSVSFNAGNLGPAVAADTTFHLRVTRGSASFPKEEMRLPMNSLIWGGYWQGWCRRDADGLGVTCPLGNLRPAYVTEALAGPIDFVPLAAGPLELTASISSSTADRSAGDNQQVLSLNAVTVPTYDTAIDHVDTLSKIVAGQPLVQRFTLKNNGPDQALGPHSFYVGVFQWGQIGAYDNVFPVSALRLVSGPPGSACLLQREAFLAQCTIGALPIGATAVVEVESMPTVANEYILFADFSTLEFHIDPNSSNNVIFDVLEITKGRQVLKADLGYPMGDYASATCGGVTSSMWWQVTAQIKRLVTRNDSRASVRDRTVEVSSGHAHLDDGSSDGYGRDFRYVRGHIALATEVNMRGGLVADDEKVELDFVEAGLPSGSTGLQIQIQTHVTSISDANGVQGFRVYHSEARCRQGRIP